MDKWRTKRAAEPGVDQEPEAKASRNSLDDRVNRMRRHRRDRHHLLHNRRLISLRLVVYRVVPSAAIQALGPAERMVRWQPTCKASRCVPVAATVITVAVERAVELGEAVSETRPLVRLT